MQLTLWEEGDAGRERSSGGPAASKDDVFVGTRGRVGRQWPSANDALRRSEQERALTRDMMERVSELSNLVAALRRVVQNGGSPGVDGMTVAELKDWFNQHGATLQRQLLDGSYEPSAVRGVSIPKPNGGQRQLGIPTCKDRLVQQAISQVVTKRYEPTFSPHSYGFRPGRSAHGALVQAGEYVGQGYRYVIDLDLEKFFDRVNHDRLIWSLSLRIGDKRLLKLIGKYLRAGMMQDGLVSQRVQGTPQGSPLSPLLSNIVLDELDQELEKRGHRFVRYADDVIVLVKSEEAAARVAESLTTFIEGRLRLKVNREKTRICPSHALNFLGHSILRSGELGLSRESEERFRKKLRQITRRNRGIALERLVQELNPVLRGWLNYFRMANMKSRLQTLESWLRRRIRCFRLKQCKRAIGIVRFLERWGVPSWRAWILALSGKGWYRLAGSPQAHESMNLKWFEQTGLYNLASNYRLLFKETAQYVSTLGGVRGA
jgi:RNA-directed DNA polymerase